MEKKKTKVNYSMSEDMNIKPWGEFTVEFQSREEEEGGDSPKDWNQELVNRFKAALEEHFKPTVEIPGKLGSIKYVLHKGAEAQLFFHLMAETMNALAAEMNQESARFRKQAEDDTREARKFEDILRAMKNFNNQ